MNKNPPRDNFLYSNIKKFLHVLKRKLFLIAGNGNPEKILYISGNGTFLYLGKLLIFQQQEITFQARKEKKTLT